MLVKKSYGDKLKRHKLRNWKLHELDKEMEVLPSKEDHDRDYTEFLETLEEDEAFRQNVNIYFGKVVYVCVYIGKGLSTHQRQGKGMQLHTACIDITLKL